MNAARAGRWLALLFLVALTTLGTAFAQSPLPVPALSSRVIDQTGTLEPAQRQSLDDKLAAFERRKGSQIVLLMVPTTAPEDIASYANRVGNSWKIGRREVGDGVLVVVAKDDRKMRIEVAKTLEGVLPDIAVARIIDGAMKPRFRQNDYAGGLEAAVDQIIARVDGEALPEVQAPSSRSERGFDLGLDLEDMLLFFLVPVVIGAQILRSVLGNKLGALATGGLAGGAVMLISRSIAAALIAGVLAMGVALISRNARNWRSSPRSGGGWSTGGWSGGASSGGGWSSSSSSGSSDSFSSGGGGDFGGGGASGDW